MIKAVLLGLWSCSVVIGAAYLGLQWSLTSAGTKGKTGGHAQKMTNVRVKPVSVPITRDGRVSGYVIANFSYSASAEALKKLTVKPDVFLFDALLGAITMRQHFDYTSFDSKSLGELSTHVKEKVNARLGMPIVEEIITEEVGYVPFEDVRGRGVDVNGRPARSGQTARRDVDPSGSSLGSKPTSHH